MYTVQAKELLTELAMVESEISRLEGQITQLRLGLKHEQEMTKEAKSKQWQLGNLNNLQPYSTNNLSSSPMNKDGNDQKMAFETKALHFIDRKSVV